MEINGLPRTDGKTAHERARGRPCRRIGAEFAEAVFYLKPKTKGKNKRKINNQQDINQQQQNIINNSGSSQLNSNQIMQNQNMNSNNKRKVKLA